MSRNTLLESLPKNRRHLADQYWIWRQQEPGAFRDVAAGLKPYTYLIQCEKSLAVKIGKSFNPAARFSRLQTGSPTGLSLKQLTYIAEEDLHMEFDRIRGEWFVPCVRMWSLPEIGFPGCERHETAWWCDNCCENWMRCLCSEKDRDACPTFDRVCVKAGGCECQLCQMLQTQLDTSYFWESEVGLKMWHAQAFTPDPMPLWKRNYDERLPGPMRKRAGRLARSGLVRTCLRGTE